VGTEKEMGWGGRVSCSLGYGPGCWFVGNNIVDFERIESLFGSIVLLK
jgi:hypothetical protein